MNVTTSTRKDTVVTPADFLYHSKTIEGKGARIRFCRRVRGYAYAMQQWEAGEKPEPVFHEPERAEIEAHEHFGGWINFAETWNIDRDKIIDDAEDLDDVIELLQFSLLEQHNAMVRQIARPIPGQRATSRLLQ